MGILSTLLLLPLKGPADSALWVAKQVADAVDQERNSPTAIKAALTEAERKLISGEMSEEEYDILETELLRRLKALAG